MCSYIIKPSYSAVPHLEVHLDRLSPSPHRRSRHSPSPSPWQLRKILRPTRAHNIGFALTCRTSPYPSYSFRPRMPSMRRRPDIPPGYNPPKTLMTESQLQALFQQCGTLAGFPYCLKCGQDHKDDGSWLDCSEKCLICTDRHIGHVSLLPCSQTSY